MKVEETVACIDEAHSVVQTTDDGYALADYTTSYSASADGLLIKTDVEGDFGLGRTDMTANTVTLYRGENDVYWNLIRVRVWKIK